MSLGWSEPGRERGGLHPGDRLRGRSMQVSLSCCTNSFPFILRPLLPLMETELPEGASPSLPPVRASPLLLYREGPGAYLLFVLIDFVSIFPR